MDVVLTPVGTEGATWSLMDRLRRPLGTVEKVDDDFRITPGLAGGLVGIKSHYPSLDAAMTAIAKHTNGACSLESQERG